jgi:3',5'-cyclic AMP phosphodiesterase CpdA
VAAYLFAVSDLHCSHEGNWQIIESLRPESDDDWLIVAGDVGRTFNEIEKVLRLLKQRYATVIWTPGNHELWTTENDPVQLRGAARYQALVRMCRDNYVLTPEDEYAVWPGLGGPVIIVPLFPLYDHSWLAPGVDRDTDRSATSLRQHRPHRPGARTPRIPPSWLRESWCEARVQESERRLLALGSKVA